MVVSLFFFFKQKTAYEMVYSDWSSDVCSSDLRPADHLADHDPLQVADALDRAPVELDDHVAGPHPGGGRGAAVEELHDLEAARPADPGRDRRPQRPSATDDAQERPPDAAVVHERGDDRPGRGVDRDREAEP